MRDGSPRLHFAYFDLPSWARWWKKGGRGVQLYYYLWQIGAYIVARRLHREHAFDVVHHVTFVKYWSPSLVSLLPAPFIWGPVGGGDSAPHAFWPTFGPVGRRYEFLRHVARWLGEHDPFVRMTARRSRIALATTEETATRLRAVGARRVDILPAVGLSPAELTGEVRGSSDRASRLRFCSVGRMSHLKGFHLALRAFAESGLTEAEYFLIGDGPERVRLSELAASLGIADRVTFAGELPRARAIEVMSSCTALVHPTLHDSGCWVCLEAMANGVPVISLDLGGPGLLMASDAGIQVAATNPDQVVRDLANSMRLIAGDATRRKSMGMAGRKHVASHYLWDQKAGQFDSYYREVCQ